MKPSARKLMSRKISSPNSIRKFDVRPIKSTIFKRSIFLLFSLTLLTGFIWLIRNSEDISKYVNRPITKVRMDNQWQRVSESEIRQLIRGYMGAGFFQFDISGVKETLKLHSWVDEVSVKRVWPDSLSLKLTENIAIARWGQGQLLNQYGEIFRPQNVGKFTSLPLLAGPLDHQISVMQKYQLLSQLLFSSGLKLSGLNLSPRGSWELTLNDSIQIIVGKEKISERLQRFIDFYEGQPAKQTARINSADLRYDNGMAIRQSPDEPPEVAIR